MRNSVKKFIVTVIAAALIESATFPGICVLFDRAPIAAAFAQGETGNTLPRQGPIGLLKQIGITESQRAQIKAIMVDVRAKNANIDDLSTRRANLKAASQRIRQTVFTPTQRAKAAAIRRAYRAQHRF